MYLEGRLKRTFWKKILSALGEVFEVVLVIWRVTGPSGRCPPQGWRRDLGAGKSRVVALGLTPVPPLGPTEKYHHRDLRWGGTPFGRRFQKYPVGCLG